METKAFYRKVLILGAITLCWLLIAQKPSAAAQKGLNMPPTTTMKAAPKVEPPPPAPPQGALKLGKIPAPVKGPQPEPPTLPRPLLGGAKMAPGGGNPDPSDLQGKTKSFFDMPKGPGAAGVVAPTDLKPPPGGLSGIVAPSDLKPPKAPGGGSPDPSDKSFFDIPKGPGAAGVVAPTDLKPPPGGLSGIVAPSDLKPPKAPGGGTPDPGELQGKTKSFFDFPKVQGGLGSVEPPPPGNPAGVVAPTDLKPPPGQASFPRDPDIVKPTGQASFPHDPEGVKPPGGAAAGGS